MRKMERNRIKSEEEARKTEETQKIGNTRSSGFKWRNDESHGLKRGQKRADFEYNRKAILKLRWEINNVKEEGGEG